MKLSVEKWMKVLSVSLLISIFFMCSQAFSVETWNSDVQTQLGDVQTLGTGYTPVFSPGATVTVPGSTTGDVLVLSSWSAETSTGNTLRVGTWQLTGGGSLTPHELSRSLAGTLDRGVATLVHIFEGVSSGDRTFNLQHKSDDGNKQIDTFAATIVAIPLTDSGGNVTLAHDVVKQSGTQSATTSYVEVVKTDNVTVSTISQNALFIAASFNSKTGDSTSAETGQWKLQYGSCTGTPSCTVNTWSDVGGAYMERKMSGSNDTGAVTLYGLVGVEESIGSGYYSARLVMKSEGGITVETLNATIVAVSLSYYYDSQIGYLSRFHTRTASGSESANVTDPITTGTSWTSSTITTAAATADIFVAGSSYETSAGSGNTTAGWGVGFTGYPPDSKGASGSHTTCEVVERYIANSEDVGSVGAVGLGESFGTGTYTPIAFGRINGANVNYSSLNVVGFSLTSEGSTLAEIIYFQAQPESGHVVVEWETASEIDFAGFHLWRSDTANGTFSQITDTLIPAEGGATFGAAYTYEDTDVTDGHTYLYKLEAIDNSGAIEFFGPTSTGVGADRKEATAVPTLSQWGAVVLFLILGAGAVLALRLRRRRLK